MCKLVGFWGCSGAGKTTLIVKIVALLKKQGLRVAVLKHDVHQLEIDQEGKDSWRFCDAGADMMVISSTNKTALIEQRACSFRQNIALFHDVDVILVEGYREAPIPKMAVLRKDYPLPGPFPPTNCIAVVTDDRNFKYSSIPIFSTQDTSEIVDFILSNSC